MQPVDFTTLTAIYTDLQAHWLPARLEQAYQRDRHTLYLGLRTLERRGWLLISWHPQAARLCISNPPPRAPDTFTFSQQLRHQIGNLALIGIATIAPWERVLDLQFGRRPGEPPLWHLYIEIMGKYSNVILANQANQIVTAAHQVSSQQSRVRPIQTGQPYEIPPQLTDPVPSLSESFERWQERISLVPGPLRRNLVKTYRGLSSALVLSMLQMAGLDPEQTTDRLTIAEWERLFQLWQEWLHTIETATFQAGWTTTGYTVMGWQLTQPIASVQDVIDRYYADHQARQEFVQLRHQITQKLLTVLEKLRLKAKGFQDRLQQSDQADRSREQADLLMAHLHLWQPGLTTIELPDFDSGAPVSIPLNPEKNAVQNAQALYKQHQKLKRARQAIEPLLAEVKAEITYLEQIEAEMAELSDYQNAEDLQVLSEIREELIQQRYLEDPEYRGSDSKSPDAQSQPYRYQTPNGLEVLVGRNNRQNDQLTFRLAGDYDLWFHSQEISGSHVLLRFNPGDAPDDSDRQFAADLAAYYSRARQSEQVPVVYTEPKHVYKPKGAKPGMTIYKHERVIWGHPQQGRASVRK
ncbi:Rqc2 family fibronectin-binding protein [Pantanalinema sp. GBBB05]|uniref:Rqc2 family fibronectin-binding protein n=1 Tax=Pantanalinema sp. GBBB05 TaxID=2604139 RepID=UPI001D47C114|nr:fibronectin/fibrinogen-binding protein [Pantanalinema sp. GBBB05]